MFEEDKMKKNEYPPQKIILTEYRRRHKKCDKNDKVFFHNLIFYQLGEIVM